MRAGLAVLAVGQLVPGVWALVALAGYFTHAVPHLAHHVAHPPGTLSPVEQTLTWLPLAGGVTVALALLALAAVGDRSGSVRPQAGSRPAAGGANTTPEPASAGGRIAGIEGSPRNLLLRLALSFAAAIGHENARARTNRALGVPPQGFAAATSCPLPERSPA